MMTTKLASERANNDSLDKLFIEHLSVISNDSDPAKMQALWQDIATRYNEPARAYHTLRHLRQLLDQFEQLQSKLQQPHLVALALYYHDIIYDPMRSDNELKSAEYAIDKLDAYLSDKHCQRVYKLILMTAKHQLDDKNDSDGAYLLDMDLSVLGADCSEYQQYAQAVRQEYAHVAKIDYRTGRTAILNGLLARPKLYLTHYYQRLEAQARENIKREIALLLCSQVDK